MLCMLSLFIVFFSSLSFSFFSSSLLFRLVVLQNKKKSKHLHNAKDSSLFLFFTMKIRKLGAKKCLMKDDWCSFCETMRWIRNNYIYKTRLVKCQSNKSPATHIHREQKLRKAYRSVKENHLVNLYVYLIDRFCLSESWIVRPLRLNRAM